MKVIYQLWGLISKEQDWDTLIRKIDRLQDCRTKRAAGCICGCRHSPSGTVSPISIP